MVHKINFECNEFGKMGSFQGKEVRLKIHHTVQFHKETANPLENFGQLGANVGFLTIYVKLVYTNLEKCIV